MRCKRGIDGCRVRLCSAEGEPACVDRPAFPAQHKILRVTPDPKAANLVCVARVAAGQPIELARCKARRKCHIGEHRDGKACRCRVGIQKRVGCNRRRIASDECERVTRCRIKLQVGDGAAAEHEALAICVPAKFV